MAIAVADLGNSRLKWARIGDSGSIREVNALPIADPATWARVLDPQLGTIDQVLISSVNPPLAGRFGEFLASRGIQDIRWFHSVSDVPVAHLMDNAATGGADRALAVLGALGRKRTGPGLVILCGTGLTVERISSDGVWDGGAIAPGLRPMANALHLMTAQVPDVEITTTPSPLGRSTIPSVQAGVFWAVIGAIRELCLRQSEGLATPPWRIWTGGDAAWFAGLVDGPGAEVAENLVLEGLALLARAPS